MQSAASRFDSIFSSTRHWQSRTSDFATAKHRFQTLPGCFREVSGDQAIDVEPGSIAFFDGVGPIRVDHHVERLAELDEAIHQTFGPLVVHVVVGGAVNEKQTTL